MKAAILTTALILSIGGMVRAQQGMGTNQPNNNSVLHLVSANQDQGLIIPQVTTTNRPTASASIKGMMIFNITDDVFQVCDGVNWLNIPAAGAGDNVDADGDTKMQVEESADEDKIRFDVAGTEAVVINSDGRIGIGTDAPGASLHIKSTAAANIDLENGAGNGYWRINAVNNDGSFLIRDKLNNINYFDIETTGAITLGTHITEPFYIASDGNVGIGTTNPSNKLTVNGPIESRTDNSSEGGQLLLRAQTGYSYQYNIDNFQDRLRFFREDDATGANGAEYMSILSNGNVGIGSLLPTEKLEVNGSIKITDGTQGAGKVLTSDATGVSSWEIPFAGNTLDAAYDEGGSGVGRTITADNGPVQIEGVDGLMVTGTYGTGAALGVSGTGTRMFFYPKKAAFRVGYSFGSYWNDANIGAYSVAMGYATQARGTWSTVGGGSSNNISGITSAGATIAGGAQNSIAGSYSSIGGGVQNNISGSSTGYATIAGGQENTVSKSMATVGGGHGNTASGEASVIAGGIDNISSGYRSAIGGGFSNVTSGTYASVSGGFTSQASGGYSSIGGGRENTANNSYSTIAGGRDNTVSANYSTIGGGFTNSVTGVHSVVAGGNTNSATAAGVTISGGYRHIASNTYATIGGGDSNRVAGEGATIPGGLGLFANTFGEVAIGTYNTSNTGNSTSWSSADRLFSIGNGQDKNNRSEALVMLKNGNTTLNGELTLSDGVSPYTLPNADGAADQVLTTDGAGNVTWESASGGAGWVLLDTKTASNSSEIKFTSNITSAYDKYKVVIEDVHTTTHSAKLASQVSANNGTSWSTTGHHTGDVVVKGTYTDYFNDTEIVISAQFSSTTNYDATYEITYYNPLGTTKWKKIRWHGAHAARGTVDGSNVIGSTAAYNAIRYYMTSGTIATGVFKIYGWKE